MNLDTSGSLCPGGGLFPLLQICALCPSAGSSDGSLSRHPVTIQQCALAAVSSQAKQLLK